MGNGCTCNCSCYIMNEDNEEEIILDEIIRVMPERMLIDLYPSEISDNIDDKLTLITLENIAELNENKKKCIICLETFKEKDKLISLPCLHLFHRQCINNWLEYEHYCPLCKLDLNNAVEDNEYQI